MKYYIEYSSEAWHDLQCLDAVISQRIVKKMRYFMGQIDPMKQAKPLKGIYKGLYRFRVGDYRAIFQKDSHGKIVLLTIMTIKHRRDVYD